MFVEESHLISNFIRLWLGCRPSNCLLKVCYQWLLKKISCGIADRLVRHPRTILVGRFNCLDVLE